MWPNPQETLDLVIFTEEILNGKLHLTSVNGTAKELELEQTWDNCEKRSEGFI